MNLIWITNMISVFLLCAIISGILIPQILLIAYRKKLFDEPDERKIHKVVVPRLGGMAFTVVMFFSLALVFGINLALGNTGFAGDVIDEARLIIFSFCAITLLYIVGIADDLIGVRYRAKFFVQIIAGLLVIAGGLSLSDLHGILWIHSLPIWIAYPLTILVIVFIINAINLIDGIDGLASGLCSVAFITYAYTFLRIEEYVYATVALANLGVLLPFFYYNVFGKAEKHTKIFMGDTGSLTIGISLCILSLKILDSIPVEPGNLPNAFVIAYAPLIIPCFDVIRVYFFRIRTGKNPFLPDNNHIHHKLLAVGLKPSTAMLIILGSSLLLVFLNCMASIWVNINILLAADAILVTGINMWLSKRIWKKRNQII